MAQNENLLHELSPYLHSVRQDNEAVAMALLESVRQNVANSVEIKRRFFAAYGRAIVDTAHAIAAVYRRGGRMLAMGNGGSGGAGSRFAVEFLRLISADRPALAAINLVADNAMPTAGGDNDGVDFSLVPQLIALGQRQDGLIGFSASGNPTSLLKAYAKAKEMGLTTIGLAGGSGGGMAESGDIDHYLVVATDSIPHVQEVHLATYHILSELVHSLLADWHGGSSQVEG